MKYFGLLSFFFLIVLAIAITLACGSPAAHLSPSCSSAPTATNNSMPQSITLCPTVADAKDYPDGEVQYVAIGTFQTAPSPAIPQSTFWGTCYQNAPTSAVTISSGGVAQCASGASGTYTVWATGGPALCNLVEPCGTCGQPEGYAKLTCP